MNRIQFDKSTGAFWEKKKNYYCNWRKITKVSWLQQAWWRQLQARWGYSPNVHSWDLLNESAPFNDQHYIEQTNLQKSYIVGFSGFLLNLNMPKNVAMNTKTVIW